MIVSMTGFGQARAETQEGTFSVEISSVNARGQEVQVRLPRELSSLEIEFHQRVRSSYRRGRVILRVEVLFRPELSVATVDRKVLKGYHDQIEALRNEFRLVEGIRIDSLLALPGVLVPPALEGRSDRLAPVLRGLLDDGLKAWEEMRRAEGRSLEADLRRNLDAFRGRIEAIRGRLPKVLAANGEALRRRVGELLAGQGLIPDEGRLAQEIAFMADRVDVSEESARIDSHLEQFEVALAEPGGQGRKLDFIVQELNREVNTLDAKTPDASVRALAVEAKADLERVREQVQNVE